MEVPLKPGVQLGGSAEDTALGWTQGHLCWGVRWAQHGWLGGYGCLPCPTVTPALHRLGLGVWGWHHWLCSMLGLWLGPEKTPHGGCILGAGLHPCQSDLNFRGKLNWKERRERQEGSSAEMLPDRHSVETAAAGCRCNERHKY